MNNFRVDLSDISAKTATLTAISASFQGKMSARSPQNVFISIIHKKTAASTYPKYILFNVENRSTAYTGVDHASPSSL